MKLFESIDDLKPFIFRITDNGGATADRFTIITCDGDYFGSCATPYHPQGFFQSGEGIDVQGVEERIESGEERDLRWIDLPDDVQRAVIGRLNLGFADWLENEPAAATRDEARDWEGQWEGYGDDRNKTPIYRDGHGFRIRDDENEPVNADQTGEGLFDTFREAVLYMLPQDYDLSGPEYHTQLDLWNVDGGPAPLWDERDEPGANLPEGADVILATYREGDLTKEQAKTDLILSGVHTFDADRLLSDV